MTTEFDDILGGDVPSRFVIFSSYGNNSVALIQWAHETHGLTPNGKRRTLFRPHRHMGAIGIREVVRWAHSGRGKYRPPETVVEVYDEDAAEKEDAKAGTVGCPAGWCGA